MFINPQNTFNQPSSPLTPGRVIRKLRRLVFPSGKVIELRWSIVTMRDDQGIWQTAETFEVHPPPEDGSVVTEENCHKLQECHLCGGITIRSYECPKCRLLYCLDCTKEVSKKAINNRYCRECAKAVKHPILNSIRKKLSGDF